MSIREYRHYLDKLNKSRANVKGLSAKSQLSEDHGLDNPISPEELGYYAELSDSKDINDFIRRIENILNRLGFSDFSFVSVEAKHDIQSQPLTTLPIELRKEYYTEKLFEKDIILEQTKRTAGTMKHSILQDFITEAPYEDEMTLTMQAIFSLYTLYGFYDFIHIFSNTTSGKVLFSVTQKGLSPIEFGGLVKGSESTLQLLCDAISFVVERNLAGTLFTPPKKKKTVSINQKPLLVLDTLANNDLNITQVASKLCISTVTANKHLEVVRKAFGVKNTIAAIKLAVLDGLIVFE